MFKKLVLATALVAASASAFAAGVTYKLDPSHTMVLASWNHFGFSNPTANFGQVDGTLVYDAKGNLHVAYYDSEGAPRFAHATCTPGAAKCTVKGAINSVPFAALSTERHGSKWIGEYESLLIDARHRILHAVWAQPVDEHGAIVARIFHARAKL